MMPRRHKNGYQTRRNHCGRRSDLWAKGRFIAYVQEHFFGQGWSLDTCGCRALASGRFTRNETVCPKTLYHYVASGLLRIKPLDLPEALKRELKVSVTFILEVINANPNLPHLPRSNYYYTLKKEDQERDNREIMAEIKAIKVQK